MAVINAQMDAAAELGKNPVSKHQIQPQYGDEQADAGRDCRTRTGKGYFFLFRWPLAGLATYPVDPYSCYMCDDNTYIHTFVLLLVWASSTGMVVSLDALHRLTKA